MNFDQIKFRNLEINGGDDLLPDGRNAHDLAAEDLRKELLHLEVPGVATLTKAQMIGRYSQCLEYLVNEGSPYSRTINAINMRAAAKELGRRSA